MTPGPARGQAAGPAGSPGGAPAPGGRTRELVEGALLAALSVVLALVTTYVPFLQMFSVVMLPAPAVVLAVRRGTRTAVLGTAAAGLILLALVGPVSGVITWLHIAGIGVPLGLGIRRRRPAGWTIAVTTAAFLVLALVSIGVTMVVSGFNPVTAAIDAYRTAGAEAFDLYGRLGLVPSDPSARDTLVSAWEQLIETVVRLLPVALVLGYAGFSLLTYVLNRAVLQRLGHRDVPPVKPFADWQVPQWTVFAFGAAAGIHLVRGELGGQAAGILLDNILMGFLWIFIVVGAAAAYAFLRAWGIGRGAAAAILALAVMMQLSVFLAGLGLVDTGLGLRRRYLPPRAGEEEAG